ncbi:MAG: sirohydrochlorin cobaltochelatase [Deltaproteobacteria bacterium]|jgi:sirohydrochlorin cobaltochelatase|nr:sirohydrochlorin cobaltochelatase [Deltaproteobacteria bacterium]
MQNATEAVVIAAFGTSVERAKVSYSNVEAKVRAVLPGRPILWAWTAHSLLPRAASADPVYTVQEALAKAGRAGVKKVYLLSLHVIPGLEYANLEQAAAAFAGLPKELEVVLLSRPLLHDTASLAKMAEILLQGLPGERRSDEAALFVGHGTHHPAGVYYPALQYYLSRRDAGALVGVVEGGEGSPDLESVIHVLREKEIKTVWLVPLMVVAGDHAMNDLFGVDPDSWQERLKAQGFAVKPVQRGLGENPAIVDLWAERLQELSAKNHPA